MKKLLFGLTAFFMAGSFIACNNDAQTSENTDTTTMTTTTSTGDYAAMADEFERNSAAGNYADVRTGQPIKISVDRTTGQKINTETNEPVTRYILIDGADWWVYDADGNRLGQAKLENGTVLFDDNGNWVDYNAKFKDDGDGETKYKSDNMKVKTDDEGNTKIKTDDQKIKTDENGTKVKGN